MFSIKKPCCANCVFDLSLICQPSFPSSVDLSKWRRPGLAGCICSPRELLPSCFVDFDLLEVFFIHKCPNFGTNSSRCHFHSTIWSVDDLLTFTKILTLSRCNWQWGLKTWEQKCAEPTCTHILKNQEGVSGTTVHQLCSSWWTADVTLA